MAYLSEETDVHTNHNVYILGAGFSKNAGMPLLKDFLNEMRSSVNWLMSQNRPELKATQNVLLFRKRAASAALRVNMNVENIEDLFSLAAASGDESAADNISQAIAATLEYCKGNSKKPPLIEVVGDKNHRVPGSWNKTQLGDERSRKYQVQLYDLYAGFLNGDLCDKQNYMANTVITFNYDTVLEDALFNIKVPIDYGFQDSWVSYDESWTNERPEQEQKLKLLKIHGSVNWIQEERELQNLTVYRSYGHTHKISEKQGPRIAIVPPTWRKDFSGPLSDVWRAAIEALRTATRIIFLGFSFPDTDAHIKYLLAAGLQENISLRSIYCGNPMATVETNFLKVIKKDLQDQGIARFYEMYVSRLLNRYSREQERHSYASLFARPISDRFSVTQFTLDGEEGNRF